jgi:hypothetical protein
MIVAALAAALIAGYAHSFPFGRRVAPRDGRAASAPLVARYEIDEGGEFILDRAARQALVKFSDSPEIWVLSPLRGPRGDMIYKNDVDEPMLRATKLGGMTVFTPHRPDGAAAAPVGPGSPLRLFPLGPVVLYDRLYQASVRTSRAAQHEIGFIAPDADATSDSLIADTAWNVVEAMISLSERPRGRAILARLGSIAITAGARSSIALRGRVVAITINPALGYAGRPSSERILQALGAR